MAFAPPAAFDYLARAQSAGRLGHAYLIIGAAAAPFDLAVRLAGLVVGAAGPAALAHADVHLVEPESKSRRIVIDQIRRLEGALQLSASVVGGRKVGIIRDSDRLQPQAANAFLKTLEEPPGHSLLLLVSGYPEAMPETILSRCLKVTLLDESGAAADAARSPEELAAVEMLDRYAAERDAGAEPSLAAAYRLTRDFSQLLAAARARIQGEQDAALERDEAHYAQTTDGAWLAEREGYYKALTEARYVAERSRLVEVLARWWGDVLRRQALAAGPVSAGAEMLAPRVPQAGVLRKLAALEQLRENLERNVQEALALEVGFLQVFAS